MGGKIGRVPSSPLDFPSVSAFLNSSKVQAPIPVSSGVRLAAKEMPQARYELAIVKLEEVLLLKRYSRRTIKTYKNNKRTLMNYQEKRYNMSVKLNSTRTLVLTKQKKKKVSKITQYNSKLQKKVFETHIGGLIIITKV